MGQSKEEAAKSGSSAPAGLELGGVEVKNSRISFEGLVADQLELHLGRVAPGAATPLRMALQLKPSADAAPMPLALQFALTMDAAAQRYQLAQLKLEGSLPRAGKAALALRFESPLIDLDLARQTLAEASFDSTVAGARLTGRLSGKQLLDGAALQGGFELAELSPRNLLATLALPAPNTRDATRLTRLAAKGSFSWAKGQAQAEGLALRLDDSQLSGRLGFTPASGALSFDMAVDRIDLDRYQAPPSAAPPAATAASSTKHEPIELPVDFLKPLHAHGQFKVGEIRVAGLTLTELGAGIAIADGLARLAPLRASVYGGQYQGEVRIDTRPATPTLALDAQLAGIDVAALMKDFAKTQRLSGRGTVTAKLQAQGRHSDALVRSLSGSVVADLADGAVEGLDLWHALAQAQSLLKQRSLSAEASRGRTPFDTFHASAQLTDGVATTRDLLVASQRLRVSGEGTTHLVNQSLDWRIKAAVLKAPEGDTAGMSELERASIPVTVTGPLADPKIRPDLAGLALGRVKEQIEQKKDVIREKVKDRLKGLLGR
jgi:AsmA protein